VDACTVTALDAITAFAVPNPDCPSQSRRFFQVWLLFGLPRRADHSAYFGLAKFYLSQPFQPSTGATLESCLRIVNALFQCNRPFAIEQNSETQLIEGLSFNQWEINLFPFLHNHIHKVCAILPVLKCWKLARLSGAGVRTTKRDTCLRRYTIFWQDWLLARLASPRRSFAKDYLFQATAQRRRHVESERIPMRDLRDRQ
jgi:hypothetical protein